MRCRTASSLLRTAVPAGPEQRGTPSAIASSIFASLLPWVPGGVPVRPFRTHHDDSRSSLLEPTIKSSMPADR